MPPSTFWVNSLALPLQFLPFGGGRVYLRFGPYLHCHMRCLALLIIIFRTPFQWGDDMQEYGFANFQALLPSLPCPWALNISHLVRLKITHFHAPWQHAGSIFSAQVACWVICQVQYSFLGFCQCCFCKHMIFWFYLLPHNKCVSIPYLVEPSGVFVK